MVEGVSKLRPLPSPVSFLAATSTCPPPSTVALRMLTDVRVLGKVGEDLHLCHDGLLDGHLLRLINDFHRILLPRLSRDASSDGARQTSARERGQPYHAKTDAYSNM